MQPIDQGRLLQRNASRRQRIGCVSKGGSEPFADCAAGDRQGTNRGTDVGSGDSPRNIVTARIAAQYQGAATALQTSSLAYLATILLVLSLVANLSAQLVVRRIRRKMGTR